MMGIGLYTGILAVTLWNICEPGISPLWHPSWSWMTVINKCWQIRRGLVVVIILLHGLTTISFATNWSYMHSAFIENGKSFRTVYLILNSPTQSAFLVGGIASAWVPSPQTYIWCVQPDGNYPHQLIIVLTLDLVLLDGLGTALACCSTSNTFPNCCIW